jgi:ribosomal protein S27AE
MAQEDYAVTAGKPARDPRTDLCDCGKSVVLPAHPLIHCPRCHCTYIARGLNRPGICARCNYNLFAFRQRNGMPELAPKYV